MKKRKILIGLGLLALPVVLFGIIFWERVEKTYHDFFTVPPSDPNEYHCKTLRRPIVFTNQMFLNEHWYRAYHFNPDGVVVSGSGVAKKWKSGLPYTRTGKKIPHILRREDRMRPYVVNQDGMQIPFGETKVVYLDEYPNAEELLIEELQYLPKDWPEEKSLEIELDPNIESLSVDGLLIVTNKGQQPIRFSTHYANPTMNFVFDDRGRLWSLGQAKIPAYLAKEHSLMLRSWIPNEKQEEQDRKEFDELTPKSIAPQESIEFVFQISHHLIKERNLKASSFFVILGDNDKIIHIFETPCEK